MSTVFWAKVHGAAVHFPVALSLSSVALDGVGFALAARPVAYELHRGGRLAMMVGTLGSTVAVISGLLMTKGDWLGHGVMRWHHLYAWPAFGLLVGLTTWRSVTGIQPPRRALGCYLGCAVLAAALVSATGYWGGELLISG